MGKKMKCGAENCGSGFCIWLMGWLFTIGFVGLGFWKSILAIIIWPYFLGVAL